MLYKQLLILIWHFNIIVAVINHIVTHFIVIKSNNTNSYFIKKIDILSENSSWAKNILDQEQISKGFFLEFEDKRFTFW